jgi:hypothetical protein
MLGLDFWTCRAAASVASVSATTWDSAASNSNFSYDAPKLVATQGANGTDTIVVATTSHTTGDWQADVTSSSSLGQIGLMNAIQSTADTWFLSSTINSIAWYSATAQVSWNGVNQLTLSTWSPGDTITVRLKNQKLYFALNGVYQSCDPVAETGGIDVSSMGAVFVAASANGAGRTFTLNPTNW